MSDILHREIEVPCSVEEAWEFVIDPSWLGDDGHVEAVPGSEGWVSDGEETRYLIVEEVDEARRFTYRWATFVDEPTRVEIDLEPLAEGTRISISESPLAITARAALSLR